MISIVREPVRATRSFAERTARLAVASLLREAEAGPKPGLVDRFGPGAHADMDIGHFRRSAAALGPFFELMTGAAKSAAGEDEVHPGLAETLRSLGVEAERAMLAATGGVNTHRGAIWTLGLLCAASGRLRAASLRARPAGAVVGRLAGGAPLGADAVCEEAARLARAIVGLQPNYRGASPIGEPVGATHGEAARLAHGLRSARGEALEGFPSIRARALPLARALRNGGAPEDERVITVLLAAMAHVDDTCLVARGGIRALVEARAMAAMILEEGGPSSPVGAAAYARMITVFDAGRLSPGGSADLCAAALFLADLEAAELRYDEHYGSTSLLHDEPACLSRA